MERSTMLLTGKSTISTGPFSIAMLVHQRVNQEWSMIRSDQKWSDLTSAFHSYYQNIYVKKYDLSTPKWTPQWQRGEITAAQNMDTTIFVEPWNESFPEPPWKPSRLKHVFIRLSELPSSNLLHSYRLQFKKWHMEIVDLPWFTS